METKEIKITPPEGYEIDKENSTFDCIKFKPVVKRWRDRNDNLISGYYLSGNGVVTDEEWHSGESLHYTIERHKNEITMSNTYYNYTFLTFHTREQRDLFLKENEDLIKDYLMID